MTEYTSPPLRITARVANHARAGMQHAATAVFHRAGRFSEVQVEALKRDPNLIVDEATADGVIHFDPGKFEAQLTSHLAQDAAGVEAVLRRMFPGLLHREATETFVTQHGAGGTTGSASVGVERLSEEQIDALVRGDAGTIAIRLDPGATSTALSAEELAKAAGAAARVTADNGAGRTSESDPPPPPPAPADPVATKGKGKGAQEAAS